MSAALIEQQVARVDHTRSAKDLTVVGSERERDRARCNRAARRHPERRVLRNGCKTVVPRQRAIMPAPRR